VQVATVCANDETFIQTCNRIACPPTEGACTPGTSHCARVLSHLAARNYHPYGRWDDLVTRPSLSYSGWPLIFAFLCHHASDPVLPVETGKTLGANIGCDVPYYRTPYNAASRTARPARWAVMLGAVMAAGLPLLLNAFPL
jgi:hypothetical protein